MRNLRFLYLLCIPAFVIQCFSSCRTNPNIIPSTSKPVVYPDNNVGDVKGFFLLNEGNMGNNKASLDYFDYEDGVYTKNIYAERNPNVVSELGDVGNDIKIYGNKLYAVINCSNFIEVMNANNAKHIGNISIPNCRYITFNGKYAYISSYAGPVQIDPNARLGYIAKVDTATLQVVDECLVGYQPEEMAVVGDKLYVANSGGYRIPDYDNTISVIDLNTFREIKKIEVAVNLHRLELDRYGFLWIASRGDHYNVHAKTYVLDTKTDAVVKDFEITASNMTRVGDSLYICGKEWNYNTEGNKKAYAIINTKEQMIVTQNFINDGTEDDIKIPYGIAVNPITKEIFVTDAKNYVTPGKIHCYSPNGVRKWSATTGDIPAHIVFTNKKLDPIK